MQNSINQIEKLELPKRSENRRVIYLGEKVFSELEFRNRRISTHLVDLSARGLAVVEGSDEETLGAEVGDLVRLHFTVKKKKFMVLGEVANKSGVFFAKKHLSRFGIRFQIETPSTIESFLAKVADPVVVCRHGVRPQARCHDSYFFDELIVFQVNGFTPFGIDLTVSARCKSILPNQPFDLEVFVPGRGEFTVSVINSNLQHRAKNNYYRLYARYNEPSDDFLCALAEYLVMFADVSPNELREKGFRVGELNQAVEVLHNPVGESTISDRKMHTAPFASSKDSVKFVRIPFARDVNVKVGPKLVAICSLAFYENEGEKPSLLSAKYDHDFARQCPQRVELVNFFINDEVGLVDIVIPLIKHAIRITIQARFRFLLLETSGSLKVVFEKFGFVSIAKRQFEKSKSVGGKDATWYLMSLDVKNVLLNKEKKLPQGLWSKLYKQLYDFLGQHLS